MIPNGIPWQSRTGFWDEGEHGVRDEAEQFRGDPVTAFGFAGLISAGRYAARAAADGHIKCMALATHHASCTNENSDEDETAAGSA